MNHYIDGIPLETLASLLPFKTRFSPFLYTNIHLLAKYESRYSSKTMAGTRIKKLRKKAQLNIIDSLYNYIKGLKVSTQTQWANYYQNTNYDNTAFKEKALTVKEWTIKNQSKQDHRPWRQRWYFCPGTPNRAQAYPGSRYRSYRRRCQLQ